MLNILVEFIIGFAKKRNKIDVLVDIQLLGTFLIIYYIAARS